MMFHINEMSYGELKTHPAMYHIAAAASSYSAQDDPVGAVKNLAKAGYTAFRSAQKGSTSRKLLAKAIRKYHNIKLGVKRMTEEDLNEVAPPGMEHVVLALKKKFPNDHARAFKIAWAQYNKKKGLKEGKSLRQIL